MTVCFPPSSRRRSVAFSCGEPSPCSPSVGRVCSLWQQPRGFLLALVTQQPHRGRRSSYPAIVMLRQFAGSIESGEQPIDRRWKPTRRPLWAESLLRAKQTSGICDVSTAWAAYCSRSGGGLPTDPLRRNAPARPPPHEVFFVRVVEVGGGCGATAHAASPERLPTGVLKRQRARQPPVGVHVLDGRAPQEMRLQACKCVLVPRASCFLFLLHKHKKPIFLLTCVIPKLLWGDSQGRDGSCRDAHSITMIPQMLKGRSLAAERSNLRQAAQQQHGAPGWRWCFKPAVNRGLGTAQQPLN